MVVFKRKERGGNDGTANLSRVEPIRFIKPKLCGSTMGLYRNAAVKAFSVVWIYIKKDQIHNERGKVFFPRWRIGERSKTYHKTCVCVCATITQKFSICLPLKACPFFFLLSTVIPFLLFYPADIFTLYIFLFFWVQCGSHHSLSSTVQWLTIENLSVYSGTVHVSISVWVFCSLSSSCYKTLYLYHWSTLALSSSLSNLPFPLAPFFPPPVLWHLDPAPRCSCSSAACWKEREKRESK